MELSTKEQKLIETIRKCYPYDILELIAILEDMNHNHLTMKELEESLN